MYIYDKQINLNGIDLYTEIEFEVSPLIAATHLDPPEGGDIELLGVRVILAVGTTYETPRREMNGWEKALDKIAMDWVYDHMDEEELYDHASNTEDSNVW